MFQKDLLIQKMKDHHMSQNCIATFLKISSNSFRNKLYGKTFFNIEEVKTIVHVLNLTDEERERIFFN